MISKDYMQNVIETSQQQAEKIESAPSKRDWADPVMVEVMRASDAHYGGCGAYADVNFCGSFNP